MEFVLLGLLSLRAMSIYDINKALERSISLFYSASFGSINAALVKMLQKGWVTAEEKVENGRNKKIFSLTAPGQQAFAEWLGSAIEEEKVKDPALTRLFFLGFAPLPERIRVLEAHLEQLRQTVENLRALQQASMALQVPGEMRDVFEYQMHTLQYGLDYYTFNIGWYAALLGKLQKENPQ